MKKCWKCGSECSEQAAYCGKCGAKLEDGDVGEKGKWKYIIGGTVIFFVVVAGAFLFLSQRQKTKNQQIQKVSELPTIFEDYLKHADHDYTVLEDDYEEADTGDSRVHQLVKEIDELPGEWYVSYYYYNGVSGQADGLLSVPVFVDSQNSTNIDDTEQMLEKIYGAYDEHYNNPLEDSIIPYSCYQWNSVENGEYSLSLVTLEKENQHYILFEEPCNQIKEKEITKALQKEVNKELKSELGTHLKVEISDYSRINANYVMLIWSDDMQMSLENTEEKGIPSDYVWIDFQIYKSGKLRNQYQAILQCVDGKWKIFGKLKKIYDYE